ncbi:phage tail assembly chaperone [Aquibium sp. ELW1220]
MAAGLGAMRLSPQAFWAMTPRERRRRSGSEGRRKAHRGATTSQR